MPFHVCYRQLGLQLGQTLLAKAGPVARPAWLRHQVSMMASRICGEEDVVIRPSALVTGLDA